MHYEQKERGCSCCDETTPRATMEKRHGTPTQFREALRNALDMITLQEGYDAVELYDKEWYDAPHD